MVATVAGVAAGVTSVVARSVAATATEGASGAQTRCSSVGTEGGVGDETGVGIGGWSGAGVGAEVEGGTDSGAADTGAGVGADAGSSGRARPCSQGHVGPRAGHSYRTYLYQERLLDVDGTDCRHHLPHHRRPGESDPVDCGRDAR